jgi:hypothetical protein
MSIRLNKELKQIIKEEIFNEILNSPPLVTTFKWDENPEDMGLHDYSIVPFKDTKGNLIQIEFEYKGDETYEALFRVNSNLFSNSDIKYSVLEYARLLSTVALAVNFFLEDVKPDVLNVFGADNPGLVINKSSKEGQKNRIYSYYFSKIENNSNYKMEKTPNDGFKFIKK